MRLFRNGKSYFDPPTRAVFYKNVEVSSDTCFKRTPLKEVLKDARF